MLPPTKNAKANTTKLPLQHPVAKPISIRLRAATKSFPLAMTKLINKTVDIMKPLPKRPSPSLITITGQASQTSRTNKPLDLMKPLPRKPCPSSIAIVPPQYSRPLSSVELASLRSGLDVRSYALETCPSALHHSSSAVVADPSSPGAKSYAWVPLKLSSGSATPTLSDCTSLYSNSSSPTSSVWSFDSIDTFPVTPISLFSTQRITGPQNDKEEEIGEMLPTSSFWTRKTTSTPPISPLFMPNIAEPDDEKEEVVGEIGATKEAMMEMALNLAYVTLEIEQLWWRRRLLSDDGELEGHDRQETCKVCYTKDVTMLKREEMI